MAIAWPVSWTETVPAEARSGCARSGVDAEVAQDRLAAAAQELDGQVGPARGGVPARASPLPADDAGAVGPADEGNQVDVADPRRARVRGHRGLAAAPQPAREAALGRHAGGVLVAVHGPAAELGGDPIVR